MGFLYVIKFISSPINLSFYYGESQLRTPENCFSFPSSEHAVIFLISLFRSGAAVQWLGIGMTLVKKLPILQTEPIYIPTSNIRLVPVIPHRYRYAVSNVKIFDRYDMTESTHSIYITIIYSGFSHH